MYFLWQTYANMCGLYMIKLFIDYLFQNKWKTKRRWFSNKSLFVFITKLNSFWNPFSVRNSIHKSRLERCQSKGDGVMKTETETKIYSTTEKSSLNLFLSGLRERREKNNEILTLWFHLSTTFREKREKSMKFLNLSYHISKWFLRWIFQFYMRIIHDI